jgi:hypothetical protein
MVFGQAPCSAGRSKRRNVSYLGLLRPAINGMSEITDLYRAKFGEPPAGTKVFIVTRQQKDGWQGFASETNEIVPHKPLEQQAGSTQALTLQPHMHKGCTRGDQGVGSVAGPEMGGSATQETGVGEATKAPVAAEAGGVETAISRITTEGAGGKEGSAVPGEAGA